MFTEAMLSDTDSIFKFLEDFDLKCVLSIPQHRHLVNILNQMMTVNFSGKMNDFKHCHRTSASRFLNVSPWDDELFQFYVEDYIIRTICQQALMDQTVYVLIDDTLSEKTKPSSRAKKKIENCSWHKSHTGGKKMIYGHQFVCVVLRCGGISLPYKMIPYEKGERTKIEIAESIIRKLPFSNLKVYIQADSWYTSDRLIKAAQSRNFQYLGALKTNRKIFPKGFRSKGIQIKDFAKTLKQKDLDLVTVGNAKYWTYVYEGRINGGHLVKIVLSWPKEALFKEGTLRCFLSTFRQISAKKLLNLYLKRWEIENIFRFSKQNFKMEKYQIHTSKGIKRYLLLVQLSYLYLASESFKHGLDMGEALRQEQKGLNQKLVRFIREETLNGKTEEQLFEALQVA
jgi:hypothetical protein